MSKLANYSQEAEGDSRTELLSPKCFIFFHSCNLWLPDNTTNQFSERRSNGSKMQTL